MLKISMIFIYLSLTLLHAANFEFTSIKRDSSEAISDNRLKVESEKDVIATGYGTTPQQALDNAFKSAVAQYVGVLVDAETVVKNNKIIKDEILTASNGYIQSYHEISTENNDGFIEIQIKAVVKSQKVFNKVKSLNIATLKINDSKNIYARVVTKKVAKEDAEKILKKSLDSFLGKESIKELLILGITDVTVREESVKDDKVPVTVSYVMEINKKIYAQKVEQLEQTFEGLGAQLQARLDLPYYHDKSRLLRVTNERKVGKTLKTDFGFIKHYGKGYKLDVWKFPASWSDIYPFRKTQLEQLSWQDYYNLILQIKRVDGEVLIAKNITNRKSGGTLLNANVVKTGMLDLYYAGSFGAKKIISPFLWTGYNQPYKGRRLAKEKEFYQVTIWINIEDLANLSSVSIELD